MSEEKKRQRRKRPVPMPGHAPVEDVEQENLMRWAAYEKAAWPQLELLVHIANERKCSPAEGARLQRLGVRKGMPDLFLFYPAGGYCGLAVEMKRIRGGRVSDEQKETLAALRKNGYAVCVARGWMTASEIIMNYLRGGEMWKEHCNDL